MGFRRTLTKLICVTAFLAWAAPASAAPATAKAPARETCGTANLLDGRKPLLATPEIKGDLRLVTDGAAAQEGAQWDAPVAVTFDSRSASITYDLGAPRSISALFVQADANDTYKILGSLDDTSASYHVIADVPNVVDRGHGLRNRALEIAPRPSATCGSATATVTAFSRCRSSPPTVKSPCLSPLGCELWMRRPPW